MEEKGSLTSLDCKILESDNKEKAMADLDEEKENTIPLTPRLEMGSNDLAAHL